MLAVKINAYYVLHFNIYNQSIILIKPQHYKISSFRLGMPVYSVNPSKPLCYSVQIYISLLWFWDVEGTLLTLFPVSISGTGQQVCGGGGVVWWCWYGVQLSSSWSTLHLLILTKSSLMLIHITKTWTVCPFGQPQDILSCIKHISKGRKDKIISNKWCIKPWSHQKWIQYDNQMNTNICLAKSDSMTIFL